MNFTEQMLLIMRTRSSCRNFNSKFVLTGQQKQLLLRAIDCGPSAGGLRAYYICYAEDKKRKDQLRRAGFNQPFISRASLIFCLCASLDKSCEKYGERGTLYSIQDTTIAGMCITFAATAQGLDSCWVGAIDSNKIKEVFHLKGNILPISLICVGKGI